MKLLKFTAICAALLGSACGTSHLNDQAHSDVKTIVTEPTAMGGYPIYSKRGQAMDDEVLDQMCVDQGFGSYNRRGSVPVSGGTTWTRDYVVYEYVWSEKTIYKKIVQLQAEAMYSLDCSMEPSRRLRRVNVVELY